MINQIGIDKIEHYLPNTFVDLKELAIARNVDPNKYLVGLMQNAFTVCLPPLDLLKMAVSASQKVLNGVSCTDIDMVIVATESSEDLAKPLSVYLIKELGLPNDITHFEIKQACLGLTIALELATNHIKVNPDKKALIVSTDIAKYPVGSNAEPTSGAGSVAMIISQNPSLLAITDKSVKLTQAVDDFYRPINQAYPVVDGPLSTETYQDHFQYLLKAYLDKYKPDFNRIAGFVLHTPYTKLPFKCLQSIGEPRLIDIFLRSVKLNKVAGNIYNGSLYLNLYGLLQESLPLNQEVLLFAYGSGASSKLFALEVVGQLDANIEKLPTQVISITEYERLGHGK